MSDEKKLAIEKLISIYEKGGKVLKPNYQKAEYYYRLSCNTAFSKKEDCETYARPPE